MKHFKLFFACMLMLVFGFGNVWGDNASVNDVLWGEDFSGFLTSGGVLTENPTSGSSSTSTTVFGGGTVSYAYTGTSKLYKGTMSAGGEEPEILIQKGSQTWTVSDIPTGGATEMNLTFKTNYPAKISISISETTKLAISGSEGDYTISVKSEQTAPETFNITFTNTYGSSSSGKNIRVDDIQLVVVTAASSSGGSTKTDVSDEQLAWSASSATVTLGETPYSLPSLTNTESLEVSYQSTAEAVATINSSGEVSILKAGTTTIKAIYAGSATLNAKTVTYTLTVNAPVTPATLPFSFTGGSAAIASTQGMTAEGLGSDYGGSVTTKLKFDSSGDNVIINFDAAPGTLSFDIKGNSFSGGTFKVQESADGNTYTDKYTYSADGNGVEVALSNTARYVKFVYVTKSSGNIGLGNIAISAYVAPAAVATPTITVGEEYFLTSTTVTLGCTTDDATIYYTLDGTDPKTSGTKQTYSDAFTINADGATTIRAIANKESDWSAEATSQTVNKLTAITPAAALEIIAALDNKTATTRNYLVAGTICESPAPSVTAGGTATYYISADGSTTSQLQVYKGLYKNNANFSTIDQIQAGDDVTIVGKLKKYNTNYELDENNAIVTHKPKARLSWSAASYTASMSGGNTFPTLTNTNGVSVTYSSEDDAVATFTDNTDYSTLQLVAAGGPVNITASFAGNETYKANSVSYALTVESAIERGTITFNVDGGDAIAAIPDATALPDPLPIPTKAGKNFVNWYTDSEKTIAAVPGATVTEDITLYAVWRDPYTVTEALAIIATYGNNAGGANDVYVAGKVSTAPTANPSSGKLTYSISVDGTASDELKIYLGKGVNDASFTAKTDVQVNDQVVVLGKLYKYYNTSTFVTTPEVNTPNHLYSLTRKAEAGLDWSAASAVVGITGDKNYPTIVNPNSLTGIKYSSSDPTVASFADENTYAITLNAAGTTTITATFDGNEDYKSGTATYSLEVRETLVYGDIDFDCDGATSCPDGIVHATNLPSPLPTVTKDGFNFGGWFTNAGKTEAATAGAPLSGDVTLYAKWIEIPTFNDPNHEWQLVTSDAQLVAGKYYVIASTSKGKVANTTLSGGYLGEESATFTDGVIAYNGFGSSKVASQSNAAVFQLGGNSTDGWTLTEVLGTETGLLGGAGSSNLAWGGTNTAWTIAIDEGDAVIGEATGNRILHNASATRFKPYSSSTSASMLLPQLYVWAEKTFKLRYDANEGTNPPTATPAVAGKAVVTDAKPTAPSGKIFDGWNENAGGTGVSYVAGDEVAVSGADVTIFAQWRDPVDYTVSYNKNGGTLIDGESDIANATVTEGNLVTVAANVYEKEGFVFGGWKLGENIYMAGQKFTMPAENVELVAQWSSLNVTDFVHVTDLNQLKDGDKVYIVAATHDRAMSTQNSGKYRDYVEIQKSADGSHVVLISTEPVEFTLGKSGDYFTFYDEAESGYLYASSSSKNYLETQTTLTDDGKWEISITDGVASIAAQGTNTHKVLKWNNSTPRFSCYESGQQPVAIYKKLEVIRENLSDGKWGTICPQQEVKYPSGASFYQLTYMELNPDGSPYKFFFDEIAENASLAAGKPYLFIAEGEAIKGIKVGDAAADGDHAYNGFVGYLGAGKHITSDYNIYTEDATNYYGLQNNIFKLIYSTSSTDNILNERAYVEISTTRKPSTTPVPMPAYSKRRLVVGAGAPNSATGVDEVEAAEAPRKIMIDGKLYILRGEKMYNANGQLVK